MAEVQVEAQPRTAAVAGQGARLRWRDELITVLLGSWLMVGLLLDGYAHTNFSELETFFTPWHAVFYSGFAATAGWMAWKVLQRQERGLRGRAAVPAGYGLGLIGMAVFAVGGAGDLVWHAVFGIEQDQDLLFSPTHTLLFAGMFLALSSPFRAAWTCDPVAARPTYREFLPVIVSVTMATFMAAFSFLYFSAFLTGAPSESAVAWAGRQSSAAAAGVYVNAFGGEAAALVANNGIASVFATNLLLLAPVLLLLRRWRLPFGTVTTLFGLVAAMSAAIGGFARPGQVAAAVVGGLAADLLVAWLRPGPQRQAAYHATAAAVPLLTWGAFFAAIALTGGIGWTVEMWTGTIVWTSLLGLVLSALVAPPRIAALQPGGAG